MSDLSTQRALAASNPLAGLRAENSKAANGASAIDGAGGESFSSVLNNKVASQKEKESAPDTASAPPPATTPSQAPKTAERSKDDQKKNSADEAGEEIPSGSPIASILMQLLPGSAINAGESTASNAALASQAGALSQALSSGLGKGRPGSDASATIGSASSETKLDGVALSADGAGGAADTNPLLSATDTPAATAMSETAIAADSDAGSASQSKANTEPDFAQLLSRVQENAGQHTSSATQATERSANVVHMEHAAGHPNWSNELGDKMTWMVTSQKQQAELVLNPPQLGRIEVSLTVSGDQANAVFTSPNAAVREMIENSLPRLREIMASSGMNLGQADVGAQSSGQQQAGNNGTGHSHSRLGALTETVSAPENSVNSAGSMNLGRPGARNGMVDIFA